jgi:hypothetical protein
MTTHAPTRTWPGNEPLSCGTRARFRLRLLDDEDTEVRRRALLELQRPGKAAGPVASKILFSAVGHPDLVGTAARTLEYTLPEAKCRAFATKLLATETLREVIAVIRKAGRDCASTTSGSKRPSLST